MKVKRQKTAKRTLSFFRNSFGLFSPYQVLVDGTFCQAALECRIHIKDQLEKLFQAPVALYTTPCIVDEVRRLGSHYNGAYLISRKFPSRHCRHTPGQCSARMCIEAVIGSDNAQRLLLATQDMALRKALRKIPGLPLLYIDSNTVILEKPTKASHSAAQQINEGKIKISEQEAKVLTNGDTENVEVVQKHKHRRAKGPNPLSVKKGKKTPKATPQHTLSSNGRWPRKKIETGQRTTGEPTKSSLETTETSSTAGTVDNELKDISSKREHEDAETQNDSASQSEPVRKRVKKRGRRKTRTAQEPISQSVASENGSD